LLFRVTVDTKHRAISVVVCTRDRSRYLRNCLGGLEKQTLSNSRFEVIVVDNGSSDDTAEIAESFCDRQAHFHYYFEPEPGLSIARNAGIRASSADIVAFIDDDAVPSTSWVEQLLGRFEALPPEFGIVGGDVIPVWESERPSWLNDGLLRPLSAGLKWSTEARVIRPGEWLVEVNSAYRKAALAQVGGFPEHLGRIGDLLLSGDGAVNLLIQRAGFLLYYDPEILVRHHIPPSRVTKEWFRRRSFWQGITMNRLHRYVEETADRLGLPKPRASARTWEEVTVPTSAAAWADLFDDRGTTDFDEQLIQLEQLGYLLESQSIVIGR
jgi:glycosyltransferase involved in cell wall biosynthesis